MFSFLGLCCLAANHDEEALAVFEFLKAGDRVADALMLDGHLRGDVAAIADEKLSFGLRDLTSCAGYVLRSKLPLGRPYRRKNLGTAADHLADVIRGGAAGRQDRDAVLQGSRVHRPPMR